MGGAAMASAMALLVGPATAATATTATTAGTQDAGVGVDVGTYRIKSVDFTNQCAQADPQGTDRVYLVTCDGNSYQRWLFGSTNPNYPDPYREVRNSAKGTCLDVDNRGGRLTGIIHTYTCNQSPNQAWNFSVPPGFGLTCTFVANLCDWRLTHNLNATAGKGYELFFQKGSGGAPNREWQLEPVS
jgi:hypothetical protein